jgi:transposase
MTTKTKTTKQLNIKFKEESFPVLPAQEAKLAADLAAAASVEGLAKPPQPKGAGAPTKPAGQVPTASPCSAPSAGAPQLAEVMYLGIDTHADLQVVVRQADYSSPQPAQKFNTELFLIWAVKQKQLAKRVICCYEAGCCGYVLCRRLLALGIECLVVQPQNWDERGKNVKTDSRDARALCDALARYDRGNKKALGTVRIPTEAEERVRSLVRQRTMLKEQMQKLGAAGRSWGLYYGIPIPTGWWKERAWAGLQKRVPDYLLELLAPYKNTLTTLHTEHQGVQEKIAAKAGESAKRPKGLGAQSEAELLGEVCEWGRFENRRQVGAYTGLCPSEYSSGGKRRQGSVNKHGNPALRKTLVETTWRMLIWQPKWWRLNKFREAQGNPVKLKISKKNVVGLARGLAIDLWRLFTGQTTLEALGMDPA